MIQKNISFKNKKSNIYLAATLQLPAYDGRYPCMLLVAGSGQHSRNDDMVLNALADKLAVEGVASLLMDKRGCGESEGDYFKSTTNDFASDVLSAYDFLGDLPEIDKNQIGLIGHSEGGALSSQVASLRNNVSLVVLLAPPGFNGRTMFVLQNEFLCTKEKSIKKVRDLANQAVDEILSCNDKMTFNKRIGIIFDNFNDRQKDELKPAWDVLDRLPLAWLKFFSTYEPVYFMRQITCPVFAIFCSEDRNVPPEKIKPRLKEVLQSNSHGDSIIKEYPGLNHQMQHTKNGELSDIVINDIVHWVIKCLAKKVP